MKKSSLLFFLVVLLYALQGCTEDPTATGISILPPGDNLRIDSLALAAASTSQYLLPLSANSTTLLLGRAEGLEARTLLRFTGLTAFDSTDIIDSAAIIFRVRYRFRDSSGTLGFTARTTTRLWQEGRFTWDSLAAPGAYSDTVAGTFSAAITPRDTVIRLRIDTAIARQWVNASSGSVVLLPSVTSSIILGFSTVSFDAPLLSISYRDSTTDTTHTFSRLVASRQFVANGDVPASPDRFVVQAGVAVRGRLHFDVSSLPVNASITRAQLELTLDPTASFLNTYANDSLIVHNALSDSIVPLISGLTVKGKRVASGSNVYVFEMNGVVQQWVTSGQNFGFIVRGFGETTTLDRFALYGSTAAAALRPRLTITYTLLP